MLTSMLKPSPFLRPSALPLFDDLRTTELPVVAGGGTFVLIFNGRRLYCEIRAIERGWERAVKFPINAFTEHGGLMTYITLKDINSSRSL